MDDQYHMLHYHNGFGFQFDENRFIIAKVFDDFDSVKVMNECAHTFHCIVPIGIDSGITDQDYLVIEKKYFNFIPKIFDTMLKLGIKFRTNNKLEVPSSFLKRYSTFSIENMELAFIDMVNTYSLFDRDIGGHVRLLDEWNWTSTKGKQFCAILNSKFGKSGNWDWTKTNNNNSIDLPNNNNFIDLTNNNNANNNNSIDLTNNNNTNNQVEFNVDENLCIICMDNIANTMVLPCEHIVICNICSNKLKNTHEAHICIYCRKEITDILIEEREE